MVITIWDLFIYIYRCKRLIAAIVLVALVGTFLYVNSIQSYSAQILIEYIGENEKSGLTPDGKQLNPYEIASPAVVSAALQEIGAEDNVDTIRKKMNISPIIPDDVRALMESKQDEGEEYEYHPTKYILTYTGGRGDTSIAVQNILTATVKQYGIYYNEAYGNQTSFPRPDMDFQLGEHDYIEVAELLSDYTADMITYLDSRTEQNADFRSPSTGLRFTDLAAKFRTISTMELPTVFSDILQAQITENEEVLIKKYTQKRDDLRALAEHYRQQTDLTYGLMEEFVASNEKVPNSFNQEQENVHNNTTDVVTADRSKTTYDDLVDKYVDTGVATIENGLDADYCDSIIAIYASEPNPDINYEEKLAKVSGAIEQIRQKWDQLYELTESTVADFNRYNASQHIRSLSGVYLEKTVPMNLYLLFALGISLVFGCLLAVVIELIREFLRHKKDEPQQIKKTKKAADIEES